MRALLIAVPLLAALPAVAQDTSGQRASEPPVVALECRGSEPFWALDLGPGTALLSRPGGEAVEETTFTGTLDTLGFLDPPWSVWRGAAASGDGVEGADDDLVAMVRREQCVDSMKGDTHGARAVISLPSGGIVTGCCDLREPLEPTAAPPAPAKNDGQRAH